MRRNYMHVLAVTAMGVVTMMSSRSSAVPDPNRSLVSVKRAIPAPRPDHPGNVFATEETVTVPFPTLAGVAGWRLSDDRGRAVRQGALGRHPAPTAPLVLGALPVGWYRVEFVDGDGKALASTTAAVLERLHEAVPLDSPVCADSATAWFARRYGDQQEEHQAIFANLAALAGVNWLRDRMSWGAEQTESGGLAENTIYQTSARHEAEAGLKLLQVFHSTPGWAMDPTLDGDQASKRFPRDLRVLYRFCKALAQRYHGQVLAWEPWNEANITGFGGHTINEMCSLQKAAYLGFKAGDPDVVVCWNVYAGAGTLLHTEGVLANEAWLHFDTYNIHSYSRPEGYDAQFAAARRAACGRPIWISECGIRVPWQTERPWGDMRHEDDLRQARFIARSYASSLFAGVNRHFFFILGNYMEHAIQFGLLRHDHTPRPGYVALAAVGRLLAGARCLGRLPLDTSGSACVYAFRGRPDGVPGDVLVGWSAKGAPWPECPGIEVTGVHDYLGRSLEEALPGRLSDEPVFVVLAEGQADTLSLERMPVVAPHRDGVGSPVVLQLQQPHSATDLGVQAYRVDAGKEATLSVDVYNFADHPVAGTLQPEDVPGEWRMTPGLVRLELGPMERRRIDLTANVAGNARALFVGRTVTLRGDFGDAGRPVVAFRLVGDADYLKPAEERPLSAANAPERWADNIVGGASMSHGPADGAGVRFEMQFGDTDPWAYPKLLLADNEVPDATLDGLALTVQVEDGEGTLRVQFIEEGGSSYLTEIRVNPAVRTPQRVAALFARSAWGSFSAPDPDGVLRPGKIRTILVGINSKKKSRVHMAVRDLAWIRY